MIPTIEFEKPNTLARISYMEYDPLKCQNPTAVKIVSTIDYFQKFELLKAVSAVITDDEIIWNLNVPYECCNSVMRTLHQEVSPERGCISGFSTEFEKPDTHVLQQENYGHLHTILLHRNSRIENGEDFNIFKFPSKTIDPQEKQSEFEIFILEIAMGLKSRISKVLSKSEVLYSNAKRTPNTYSNQSIKIFHEGEEHFPGLSIFAGLLSTRFKYSFDITGITIKEFESLVAKVSNTLKDNYSLT